MGINVEFCPDLALRKFGTLERKAEECLPEKLYANCVYDFLKKGQKNYWLSDDEFWSNGEMPLCETTGDERLSRPIASVKMLEVTHFLQDGEVWTKGRYKVVETFDVKDSKINFEGCKRVR